jgi:type IV pilus assembly protein PilA
MTEEEKTEKSKKSKKKGCLIIILIFFSFFVIIGVVGINMSQSFMLNAQISATETNHENSKSYIAASIKKCSSGSTYLTIGTTSVKCNSDIPEFVNRFSDYFNSILDNPYKADEQAFEFKAGNPALGSSNIYYSSNNIIIITNTGDEDGGDVYLFETIVKG